MASNRLKSHSIQPPPRTLNVQKFAESRAPELESLHSIVTSRLNHDFRSHRSKRRRTTSYDDRIAKNRSRKRRKLGKIEEGRGSVAENDGKKVSRQIRRRIELKSNPVSGFCVSGDGSKRLRTHVWHAKRFKMTKRWGFYLPLGLQGRGRGSRSVLKWLRNGALIHDASYNCAVQLEGPEAGITFENFENGDGSATITIFRRTIQACLPWGLLWKCYASSCRSSCFSTNCPCDLHVAAFLKHPYRY